MLSLKTGAGDFLQGAGARADKKKNREPEL